MRRVESHQVICRSVLFIHYFLAWLQYQLQETAKFNGQVFADPTRKLYHALGMNIETMARTPKGEQRRSYLSPGFVSNAIQSIWVNTSCLASWCLILTVLHREGQSSIQVFLGNRETCLNLEAISSLALVGQSCLSRLSPNTETVIGPQCTFASRMRHTEDRK
jgi:hypothetical protein